MARKAKPKTKAKTKATRKRATKEVTPIPALAHTLDSYSLPIEGGAARLTKSVDDWPAGTEGIIMQVSTHDSKGRPETVTFKVRQNANSILSVNYKDIEAIREGFGGY